LPVEAQPKTVKPSSTARVAATETDAILVGQRRVVDAVVLDVELADAEARGQAIGATSGVKPR
jgi:hypothetical protein